MSNTKEGAKGGPKVKSRPRGQGQQRRIVPLKKKRGGAFSNTVDQPVKGSPWSYSGREERRGVHPPDPCPKRNKSTSPLLLACQEKRGTPKVDSGVRGFVGKAPPPSARSLKGKGKISLHRNEKGRKAKIGEKVR